MVPAQAESDYGSWIVEESSLRIDYLNSVLEDVCAAATQGLYRFRHGGMEVGGILYGTAEEGLVRILAIERLDCEHAFGPRFVLSERDRAELRQRLEQSDPALGGLEPVGWYHSHTRSEIALSPRDLEIYDRFFPGRWQVALVVRPDHFGPARAGFFFRESSGEVRTESSYYEFMIQPRRRAGGPLPVEPEMEPEREPEPLPAEIEAPPEPIAQSQPQPEPAAPATPAPPVQVAAALPLPAFAQVQPRRSRKWLWVPALLVLAALATITALYYARFAATPQPLALWVADVGGQLLIEWDRTARPVRLAQHAALEIRDGAEHMEIEMDGDRLREGSVDYARHSEIVDVRLRVARPGGGQPVEEFIRFIGQPVQRVDPAEQTKQIEELKAEVEKLRTEIKQKDYQIYRLRGGQ